MSGDMEAAMTTSITDADRATATALLDGIGLTIRTRSVEQLIADALAAERAKALAPLLALADELGRLAKETETAVGTDERSEYRADQLGLAMGYRRAAIRVRAAAGPDRTAGEEAP